jgi:MFS family permease
MAATNAREVVLIFVLCSTQLFMQGALGYTLNPLPYIGKTFNQAGHEHAAEMNWHIASYSLTVASFILIAGRLGDIYGSRRVLLFGGAWFGIWTITCGCTAFTGR